MRERAVVVRRVTQRPRAKSVLQWAAPSTLLLASSALLFTHYALLDGVKGLVFPIVFPDSTVYAPNYKEDAFRKLSLGMSKQDVIRVLGPPLEKDTCDGLERWRYSGSSSDSHYRVRQLIFKNGHVVERTAFYLVD